MLKRVLLGVALLGLPLAAVAAENKQEKEYKIRWVLAHEPVVAFEKGAKIFKEMVEKDTNGKVKIEILTAKEINGGKPISEQTLFKMLSNGEFEMSQTFTTYLGSHSQQFWALDLPFLFRDHKHAAKVLEGKVGNKLMASLEPSNMKGLAFTYSGGFRVIPTNNRELKGVEDFKGLRVRVSNYAVVASSMMRRLGAEPTPLSPESGSIATANDQLDGLESTLPRYWDLPERNTNKVVNETEHSLFLTAVITNKQFFDSLPAEYQAAIKKAATHMARIERKDSIKSGDEIRANLEKQGYKLVRMNAKEKARFKKATMPVYDEFKDIVGADLVKEIQSTY